MARLVFSVFSIFLLIVSTDILSARQDVYSQKKVLRDVQVQIGDLTIYFDYQPILVGDSLRESVLANIEKKAFPLVIIPIKIRNVSENENFYELIHRIRADIIIYSKGNNAIGGFEAFFYLDNESEEKNSPRRHKDGPEIFIGRDAEYAGQIRTVSYPDKNELWFLKPTIKPDMEVYAKVAISVDGFEAMYFTTAPVKVGAVY